MKRKNLLNSKMGMAAMLLMGVLGSASLAACADEGLDMSTAYPGITVKAGESVSFDLDFDSLSDGALDAALSVESIPEGWEGYFMGNKNQISEVHVGGKGAANDGLATFSLSLPDEVEEGTYSGKQPWYGTIL